MKSWNRTAGYALPAMLVLVLASCGGGETTTPSEEDLSALTGIPGGEEPLPELPLQAPDPEQLVARVGDTEIHAAQVYGLARMNAAQLLASGQNLTEHLEEEMLRVSLELLIDNELIIREARESGMTVDPAVLAEQIQAIQDQAGTAAAFRERLDSMGITEEQLRQEAERNLLAQQYVQKITDAAPVSEDEARKFYDENPEMFLEGEQARVSQILVRTAAGDTEEKKEDARARIEEAHARAVGGEEFGALAKEYSQIPNAAKGGDVGFFPRGVMVPTFEQMAFETPVGELSPVFETPYGFNIILVTERKPATPIAYEEVRPNLMLELAKRKGAEAVSAKAAELRSETEIEYLDPAMAPREPEEAEPQS